MDETTKVYPAIETQTAAIRAIRRAQIIEAHELHAVARVAAWRRALSALRAALGGRGA